jgi:hypothetical protein
MRGPRRPCVAWRSRCARLAVAALGLVFLGHDTTRAAAPPDLSGLWTLNHALSDDAAAKIKEAAGSQYVQGRPSWAAETILPWGRKFDEGDRVLLREVLLGAVRELERLEVEQGPAEIRTIHGKAGIRTFYLTRKGAGTTLLTGEKTTREAKWDGDTLVLKSSSGKTKTREAFTLSPARDVLVHMLHVEMDLLKKAIDLRLVYDRAQDR